MANEKESETLPTSRESYLLSELTDILYPEDDPEAPFTSDMADEVSQVIWKYKKALEQVYPHGYATLTGSCSICGARYEVTVCRPPEGFPTNWEPRMMCGCPAGKGITWQK